MTELLKSDEGVGAGDLPKHTPKACKASDLFTISADTPADVIEALDAYLGVFAAPVKRDGKHYCLNCDEVVDGLLAAMGFGVAYRWGLAHGEAQCSGCGWPARGMHYIKDADNKDLASLRNLFLAYHPDQVTAPAALTGEGR